MRVVARILLAIAAICGAAAWNPPRPPAPTFTCEPAGWNPRWQIACQAKYVWPQVPTWEVYVSGQEGSCPSDIEDGPVVYLSRTYMRQPFAVVMKLWRDRKLLIVTKWFDAQGHETDGR